MSALASLRRGIDGAGVARSMARITAALGDGAAPRSDERWHVDLEVPRFSLHADAEPLYDGPCQLVGTHVDGDGLLFADRNPSIAENGHSTLFARLRARPELADVLADRAHACDERDAHVTAAWLALRAGYSGVFRAPVERATAYLAIDLGDPAATSVFREPYCTSCGTLRRAAKKIIAGPDGVGVCDRCGETLAAILDERGPAASNAAQLDDDAAPTLCFCQLCGERKGGLVIMSAMGVCADCGRLCVDILRRG